MYKLSFFLLTGFLLTAFLGCKKEETPRFCWQRVDNFGNELEQVCNKTEAEMQALYANACSYYKPGGEKACWTINGNYIKDATAEKANFLAKCFYGNGTPVKVDCNACGRWFHREKRTYKPNNTFALSQTRVETFCGDTAKTIFHGRQVILKDTPDSLVVRQFSSDGTNW